MEPEACPTLTWEPHVDDRGDIVRMSPLIPMHSLGHGLSAPAIHAGDLRDHGIAPLVCAGVARVCSSRGPTASSSAGAALTSARTEGLIVAPETSHAAAAVIDEVVEAREAGEERVIVFCLSGHGLLDLKGYELFLGGRLENSPLSEDVVGRSLAVLDGLPRP